MIYPDAKNTIIGIRNAASPVMMRGTKTKEDVLEWVEKVNEALLEDAARCISRRGLDTGIGPRQRRLAAEAKASGDKTNPPAGETKPPEDLDENGNGEPGRLFQNKACPERKDLVVGDLWHPRGNAADVHAWDGSVWVRKEG